MDFFASQDHARKKTGRLVILFVIAVMLIMLVLHFVAATALMIANAKYKVGSELGMRGVSPYLNPVIMFVVAGVTLLIVFLGSAFKIAQLSAGGHVVAESLGGKRISPNTTDLNERRVLNVVEEMAIASGIAVPPVYMMEKETGINAFAAGYTPKDAVIGVTRGSVELLSRDELQGVIAHEFSHILNGDMRLNIRLIGILNGILVIGMMGYFILRFMPYASGGRRRSSKDSGGATVILAILLVGAGMAVVGFVGTFFGNMIKAGVSRQREFLADASAVQFTRNPDGIGHALQKIGGYAAGSAIQSPNAPQASHMFFGQGVKSGLSGMFATHPPLGKRIKQILPDWSGKFPKVDPLGPLQVERGRNKPSRAAAAHRFDAMQGKVSAGVETMTGSGPAGMLAGIAGLGMLEMIGRPTPAHVEYAAQLINSIPEDIKAAARDVFGARAIVFALLLDRKDGEVRQKQMKAISDRSEYGLYEMTEKLFPAVESLGQNLRLPLIDLAIPALRAMSNPQFRAFQGIVNELKMADDRIDLFEWSLTQILKRNLEAHFVKPERRAAQYYGLQRLTSECSVVLSVLAHSGTSDPEQAAQAFRVGAKHLGLAGTEPTKREAISWAEIDSAVSKLNLVSPTLMKKVIEACALGAAADREITESEAELLRAFADGLGVPIPPLLPGQPIKSSK